MCIENLNFTTGIIVTIFMMYLIIVNLSCKNLCNVICLYNIINIHGEKDQKSQDTRSNQNLNTANLEDVSEGETQITNHYFRLATFALINLFSEVNIELFRNCGLKNALN